MLTRYKSFSLIAFLGLIVVSLGPFPMQAVFAQDMSSEAMSSEAMSPYPEEELILRTFQPQFLSPVAVVQLLGAFSIGEGDFWRWIDDENSGEMNIRLNPAANLVLFNGPESLIDKAMAIITKSDIAPRQIEIEVWIVEINADKAEDLGYDWTNLLNRSWATVDWTYDETEQDIKTTSSQFGNSSERWTGNDRIDRRVVARANTELLSSLHILQEQGFGSVRVAPRILTLNNRSATIIDGQRVTYVTRYSSYTNLYETDSMDAGLIIKATPSIGESGFITLEVTTEFTSMGASISGSPIKTGQIIENTVIIRDGESALLGGFSRKVESVTHRRVPLLGRLLPFLFSRKITSYTDIETIIVLTPKVVDFATSPNPEELEILDEE
jgi:type II secretory pathway component GspD/PulD (secretin)